ncbi:MAG: rhodanese-like domain-containing protein [Candidatus Sericytochromatia bacterium]|nr:rhodanese-like domain-containing protein [Candidatus Sericytochromatia bacterium]
MLNWLWGGTAGEALTTAKLAERLAGPEAPFLLDVREPGEYAAGHVAGATLIPLGQLGGELARLPKEREIAVICRSGARSGRAVALLRQAGFEAHNVEGGMLAWQGPVEGA